MLPRAQQLPALSAVLPGIYTVTTVTNPLPSAAANQAKYAFVSDLGGGADMVLSDGTAWKHIRRGVPGSVAVAATVTVTPLVSPPILTITGTITGTAALISIATANLYAGYELTLLMGNIVGIGASLGITVAGSGQTPIPIINGGWGDYVFNGTLLQKIRSGTL